jgi:hypothetical protein
MGKSGKYTDKELDLLDKLKHENEKLKRELKTTRKQLDRYAVAEEKGLIEKGVVTMGQKRRDEKALVEKWRCYDCNQGILKLVILGNRYLRICDVCGKRTKSQVWHDKVEGIE